VYPLPYKPNSDSVVAGDPEVSMYSMPFNMISEPHGISMGGGMK